MEIHKPLIDIKSSSPRPKKPKFPLFTSPNNTIAPYILLKLLLKMRDRLSPEAMENFTQTYIEMVETHYPRLKHTVSAALKDSDIRKLYKDLTTEKEDAEGVV